MVVAAMVGLPAEECLHEANTTVVGETVMGTVVEEESSPAPPPSTV